MQQRGRRIGCRGSSGRRAAAAAERDERDLDQRPAERGRERDGEPDARAVEGGKAGGRERGEAEVERGVAAREVGPAVQPYLSRSATMV